jgi:hypothetical protein
LRLPRVPLWATVGLHLLGAVFVYSAAGGEGPKSRPTAAESFSFTKCQEAWRRRAQAANSLRFSWTQTERLVKGMLPRFFRHDLGKEDASIPKPPTDTTLTGTFDAVLDGGAIRFEENADVFSAQRNAPYHSHNIRIFANNRFLSRTDKHDDVHAIGEIQPPARNTAVVRERDIVPLVLFFRILDPQLGRFAAPSVDVEPNPIVVDGHQCRVVRWSRSAALTDDLCVDVERNYIPLRYTQYEDGHVDTQWSITKVSSPSPGLFCPSEWEMAKFRGDGRLISQMHGIATRCDVSAEVRPSEFELEFPPGTWVFDNVAQRQYVVQKTGVKRDVPQGFGSAKYDWLMDSANNERQAFGGRRTWLLVAGNLVALLIIVGFLLHRRRPLL